MAKSKKGSTPKPTRRKQKPTKEETVEQSSLSLLAGNMPPSKDLIYWLETLSGWQDKARTAQSKVSDCKKKMKESGVDVKSVMETLRMERLEPLDLAVYLRQQATLMTARGLPVQMVLYESKFGSLEAQAAHEGWQDGINGRNQNDQRWPEQSPGAVEYRRRWNDAQAEIIERGAAQE